MSAPSPRSIGPVCTGDSRSSSRSLGYGSRMFPLTTSFSSKGSKGTASSSVVELIPGISRRDPLFWVTPGAEPDSAVIYSKRPLGCRERRALSVQAVPGRRTRSSRTEHAGRGQTGTPVISRSEGGEMGTNMTVEPQTKGRGQPEPAGAESPGEGSATRRRILRIASDAHVAAGRRRDQHAGPGLGGRPQRGVAVPLLPEQARSPRGGPGRTGCPPAPGAHGPARRRPAPASRAWPSS